MAQLSSTDHGNVKTYRTLPLIALEVGPEALRRLASDPNVVRIQEDVAARAHLAQSVPLIGADVAWAQGHAGAGWSIAILDSGVARNHRFLVGKVVSEACYSSTGTGFRSLCPGGVDASTAPGSGRNCAAGIAGCDHGTHVAGIAAGRGPGFSGVARAAQLISIQVFSRFTGDDCFNADLASPCALTFTSDQIRGLERVLELSSSLEIAAVNMSLGGPDAFPGHCDDDLRKLAIDELRSAGIATVAAAGNEGYDGRVDAPACISSAIAVGSTTKHDRISTFSNHGDIVDLLAPGSQIRSSVPGGRFAIFDGTSMATAHVAGAFAILRGADPLASVDEIETALTITGRPIGRAGIAKPRLRVDAALAALLGTFSRPFNDNFGRALALTDASGAAFSWNVDATAQTGEPTHGQVGGGHSVWWRWRAPQSGSVMISTFGSDFDTVLAVYRGSGLRRLTEVASNDDSGGSLQSQVQFQAAAGRVYRIGVDGDGNAEGNIVLGYALPGTVARQPLALARTMISPN